MTSQVRNMLLCLLLLLAALTWFYLPFITGQQCFYRMDTTLSYEPLLSYIGRAFAHGRIPLWNSLLFCGMPQTAMTSPGVFYPGHLLFAFLSFSQALAILLVLQQTIMAIGGYLLVCDLGWGTIPAAMAALTLSCCGYMFSMESNPALVVTISWLPMCVWALLKIRPVSLQSNAYPIAFSAMATSLLILGGRPELWLPALALLAVIVITCPSQSEAQRKRLQEAVWRLIAISLGILLSMPAILPALEWLPQSPRAHGLPWQEVLSWSASWYHIACLALIQPLGDVCALRNPFHPILGPPHEVFPLVASTFVGPFVITLAIWALGDRTFKARGLLLIGFLIFLCLSLGANFPLTTFIIKSLPGLSLLRYPVKLMIFPCSFLAYLAARGTYVCLKGKPALSAEIASWILWSAGLFASIALMGSHGHLLGMLYADSAPPIDKELLHSAEILVGRSGMAASGTGLLLLIVARLSWSQTISAVILPAFILSGEALLLFSTAFGYLHNGAPSDYYGRTSQLTTDVEHWSAAEAGTQRFLPLIFDPVTRPIHYQGSERLSPTAWFFEYSRQLLLPNCNLDSNIASASGAYDVADSDYHHRLLAGAIKALSDTPSSGVSPVPTGGQPVFPPSGNSAPLVRFCRLTATKYLETPAVIGTAGNITTLRPLSPYYFELVHEYPNMNARIFRLVNSLPRAYFARSWRPLASSSAFMKSTLGMDEAFDPALDIAVEFLQKDDPASFLPHELPGAQNQTLTWINTSDEHFSLSVKVSAPSLLVISDSFYPGWQATVDGRPTEIYRTNLIQRSIMVPSGEHKVTLDYRPQSLAAGLVLSIMSMTFIFGLCLRSQPPISIPGSPVGASGSP